MSPLTKAKKEYLTRNIPRLTFFVVIALFGIGGTAEAQADSKPKQEHEASSVNIIRDLSSA